MRNKIIFFTVVNQCRQIKQWLMVINNFILIAKNAGEFFFQEPAIGEPNKPTESSNQSSITIIISSPQKTILCFLFFTFLKINSSVKAKAKSNAPITVKSKRDQFTSLVICIATNGMSKIIITVITIPKSVFFLII